MGRISWQHVRRRQIPPEPSEAVLGSASGRSALIVEHGANHGTLAAARALDRAGWSVALVSSGESSTGASRSVRSRERIDYVEPGALAFVDLVARVVREVGAEIVFAVDETQLLLLSRHREDVGAGSRMRRTRS